MFDPKIVFVLAVIMIWLAACLEQYDPTPQQKQFEEERSLSGRTMPTLGEKGEFPDLDKKPGQEGGSNVDPITAKYNSLCASCHGANGRADGAAAAGLNPKPRDFSDKAWQSKTSDERIAKVIKDGGQANGLSPTMAAWGSLLSEDELTGLVNKVRSFGK